MPAGAVKDSVVGEERLAQYLLAILNSRKTPLHWERLVNVRTERSGHESHESNEPVFSNSLPRRRRQFDNSDVLYIEVLKLNISLLHGILTWKLAYNSILFR